MRKRDRERKKERKKERNTCAWIYTTQWWNVLAEGWEITPDTREKRVREGGLTYRYMGKKP